MKILTTAAALLIAGTATQAAFAQSRRAARPAASAPGAASSAVGAAAINAVPGTPISGLCAYNDDRSVGLSTVGKAAASRMQQLRAQVTAELSAEQTSLQTDAKAVQAKRASLTQAQLQQQGGALQQRAEQLDRKAQVRSRELEVTGQKALQQIHAQIVPIVQTISAQRSCSILLSGDSVIAVNPAMDLTQAVVDQLNTRMTTISFDREHLDTQAAAGAR